MTLGLAALSLFLLLGGYRNSISYGSLEDLGPLVDSQANAEIRLAVESRSTIPDQTPPGSQDLLLALRSFFNPSEGERSNGQTSLALIDRDGRVIPGYSASPADYSLENAIVKDVTDPSSSPSATRKAVHCQIEVPGKPPLLCVRMALSQKVLEAFPGTEAAAIIVAKPAASLGEVVGDLMPRLLFSGLIGVAAALVLGFLLSQSVAAPLRNIARAARSVARGNYRQRVPATGPTEVRELAASFNRMTEEVQRSQQTLRDLLANISHELKTPLTSIHGFSEALLDGTIDDPPGIQRSARIISDESTRVLRLVQELLDLSRLESGQVSMQQDDVNLNELFEHVTEVFALRSEDSGVSLDMNLQGRPHIRGDFDRLEQVMNNLLDNAFRHTPRGGTVRITSRNFQPETVQITVSDTGCGISPEEVPHLFERFYRSGNDGNNSNGSKKGHGLGLAISREIVRAHGGEIWATSEPEKGTTFVFSLPTAGRVTPKETTRRRR
ncbi:MAG: HAMP domain-containing sensor histidine kinase [Anaerolineaceae bacterium]